ncbi:MAG: sigma 54-interacting transcriptional regulator [Desulfatibacillum sp.]|nr:sigma 54-interacting transcriptional regulator [Desulfatibacillum sp.]
MDENWFFREATLRICGSLNLHKAMEETLGFLKQVMPADSLFLGLYDEDYNVGRHLCQIGPSHWPRVPDPFELPEILWERLREEWNRVDGISIVNDILEEDPVIQTLFKSLWPEDASTVSTDLILDSQKIGVMVLGVEGKGRYTEEHARLLRLLNRPFSIAMANALQHQETVRLKEMVEDDNRYLRKELRQVSGETIIGADFGLRNVMEMIRQVAPLESPVLLLGETGTGKEVLANAIHSASSRREAPFVKVNCGGLPESLVDSELFGHEKGAFTGAISQKRGRFERAHGGTIFLDEIGELPLAAQVKLLRVLQHREIERVGGSETLPVDVRIISATHRNLEEMIRQGEFREDLWFRLNVFPIMIPPLRQRRQDIPALVDHLMALKRREMKIAQPVRISPAAVDRFKNYDWPGNIRELANMVERSLILGKSQSSGELIINPMPPGQDQRSVPVEDTGSREVLPLDEAVAFHILKALEHTGGKVSGPGGAAEVLGIHPSTLRGKMRKLGISPG